MAAVAAGVLSGEIYLLNEELKEVGVFPRQELPTVSLARSENFLLAATGRTAKIFDFARPAAPAVNTYEGHGLTVTSAEFGEENRWIFTASEDKTVKIWDFRSSGYQVSIRNSSPILSATLLGNGAEIVFGDLDGNVGIWDLTGNRLKPLFQTRTAVTAVATERRSLRGEPLVVGLSDGGIFVSGGEFQEKKSDASASDSGESVRPFYPGGVSISLLEMDMCHKSVVSRCRVYRTGVDEHRIVSCSLGGTVYDDRKIYFAGDDTIGALDAVCLSSGELVYGFFDGRLFHKDSCTNLPSGVCSLVAL